MNKTKIEWCDYTWNPATGCEHGCPYCYARKIAERFNPGMGFAPTFHAERLNDPMKMKKPKSIFVVSMGDLFGDWVPDLWIEMVFAEIQKAKQHTYLFLTKNPKRYLRIPGTHLTNNLWFGTTVTGIEDTQRICDLQKLPEGNKFISFEPLLTDPKNIDLKGIGQIIIGARTNPLVLPPAMAEANVYYAARRDGAKIFYKDSIVNCHPKEYTYSRELCWTVHK